MSILPKPLPSLAVYCGSRLGTHPEYAEQAFELGRLLAGMGVEVVYGGASIGLMGKVADGALAAGGKVLGVIPEFMLDYEVAHNALSRLEVTHSMHERKALMAYHAAGFVALPGGVGTLEEILEIATWHQLEQHNKPMFLMNWRGFYNPLVAHLDQCVSEGFMPLSVRQALVVVDNNQQLLERLTAVPA